MFTWLPLRRYTAAFSACLPHKVQRIAVASSSRLSPEPRRVLLIAVSIALATLPSRPLTKPSRTGPARWAWRWMTRTLAMIDLLARETSRATDRMALKTDPLARTHLVPALGRAEGGRWPLPSREEVGDGWCSRSRSSE